MLKTRKGTAKRIRLRKSGSLKRGRAGKGHLNASKTRKRKRQLRRQGAISAVDDKRIRRLLPNG
ncbi:MAG: 50S ribosomal protein L35 [Candidatus Omnitrophica bacterium]|jgi:large subunit ribosomal protein L35|nr:50S ribosomal protein L35 [Candidatus Omnitrophota bacterium]